MNLTKSCSVLMGAVFLILGMEVSAHAQQIPPGIRYRKAPDEINEKAKSILDTFLANKVDGPDPVTLSVGAVVCGPLLWEELKSQAGPELQLATRINFFIGGIIRKEGRRIFTPEQKRAFWQLFIEKIKAGQTYSIRKAEASELQYYWVTISFDIEEPLLVIDFAKQKVLVQFVVTDDGMNIFWMDIVGDLAKIRAQ
jgi:hypothetical protein